MLRKAGVLALLALSACGTPDKIEARDTGPVSLSWAAPQKHIVLFLPQFDLREVTDITDVRWTKSRDDWNAAAQGSAASQLGSALEAKGVASVTSPAGECSHVYTRGEDMVGAPAFCGEEMENLRMRYSADFALVLQARTSFAQPYSTGDVLGMAALAAISVPLPGLGIMFGLAYAAETGGGYCNSLCGGMNRDASARGDEVQKQDFARLALIDLRTGDVVWSRVTPGGDWRDKSSARQAIGELLVNSPL